MLEVPSSISGLNEKKIDSSEVWSYKDYLEIIIELCKILISIDYS